MSVHISHLCKKYGTQWALDDISFLAEKGQITGFLGPNGAGKSTTMKIVTGYLPPFSGSVSVSGIDVLKYPQQVQQKIGYLPEHNPLYLDMYVHEYLDFVASVYRLKNSRKAVLDSIERVGLVPEQGKKIGTLSKGYRQRVGLAQALVHDPEILVLDEPLTGLDPNQIGEIRALIKELGKDKTVVFSTHIMQEVQYLCDKVVIIHQGKIVADKSLEELKSSHQRKKSLHVEFAEKIDISGLRSLLGVLEISPISDMKMRIYYEEQQDIRPDVLKWATENGNSLLSLAVEEDSLEKIFQQLTT